MQNVAAFPRISGQADKLARCTQIFDNFLQEVFGPFQLGLLPFRWFNTTQLFRKFPQKISALFALVSGVSEFWPNEFEKTVPVPQLFAFEEVYKLSFVDLV